MASSRRKQDEKHLKILRELGSQTPNRTCFDCHQRGTTYINMTVGSFVCTSCSGILRGLNPPHRVKSISMASFTPEEIEQIKSKGNQYCHAVWLGLYDAKANPFPDTKDEHKIRDFMILKYEKKRFHVEPSIALKNMPPQTSSANSSNASTPSSETSNKVGGATLSSSVSRPNVSSTQNPGSAGGVAVSANGGAKTSTTKPSASLDLLAELGGQSSSSVATSDPFASPTSAQAPASISQPSFANFENANIFTNTASSTTSNKSTPSGPPPFSNNPLTPMTPGSSSTLPPSSTSSATPGNPSQDRYAALKDLDEEFKTQKESETGSGGGSSWPVPNGNHQNSSSVFGSASASMNGGGTLFGSPGSSGGVFGGGLVNGGSAGSGTTGVFGTPPTNNGSWANFSGANPFSAATGSSSNNGGGGGAWINGGGSFGSAPQTQQGFGSVVQPGLFGTTPDPNFNQFGPSGPMNGATATATNNAWANFSQQQSNTKMQWMSSNGTANPFMAAPQLPSNGTSYNPFL